MPSTDPARAGLRLVAVTLGYNVAEAVVALGAGIAAGSVALVGFGLDSVIECVAAVALLWRLRLEAHGAPRERVEAGERRVQRVVGVTFLVLAPYVAAEAAWTLWRAEAPAESTIGIVLAAVSLVLMPLVAWAKFRVADRIGSAALRAEAKETLACSYLSFALLLGLVAHSALGWWWADPAAALLMVPWLIREGLEGVRGEEEEEGGAEDEAGSVSDD